MSAPVDVLAVLDEVIHDREFSETVCTLREARAAVAELIEAANRAAIAACRGDGSHSGTIRNADLDALRAAIARIGGAT